MGALIKSKLIPPGDEYIYSDGFKIMVETHLNNIRSNANTNSIPLTEEEINKNLYDFYGYLKSINIKMEYWWIILRVNNMHSPDEFDFDKRVIQIPSTRTLDNIKQLYRQIEK